MHRPPSIRLHRLAGRASGQSIDPRLPLPAPSRRPRACPRPVRGSRPDSARPPAEARPGDSGGCSPGLRYPHGSPVAARLDAAARRRRCGHACARRHADPTRHPDDDGLLADPAPPGRGAGVALGRRRGRRHDGTETASGGDARDRRSAGGDGCRRAAGCRNAHGRRSRSWPTRRAGNHPGGNRTGPRRRVAGGRFCRRSAWALSREGCRDRVPR